MKYDLSKPIDVQRFKNAATKVIAMTKSVELKEVRITRSMKQNRALHVFFTIISNELNELGMEFQYTGLKGSTLSTRYTPHLVKEFFWRPVQIALFDIQSTTKIDTKQINEINDVIIKFFAERGVELYFPSIESLLA
jgi:hypothetical protein